MYQLLIKITKYLLKLSSIKIKDLQFFVVRFPPATKIAFSIVLSAFYANLKESS